MSDTGWHLETDSSGILCFNQISITIQTIKCLNESVVPEEAEYDFKPFCRKHTWVSLKTSMMTSLLQRKLEKIKLYLLRNRPTFTGFELYLDCWCPVRTETEAELQREQSSFQGRASLTNQRNRSQWANCWYQFYPSFRLPQNYIYL